MCKTEKMQRCIIYLNSFIFFGTVELPTQVSILLKQLYNQIGSHSERVFTDHPHLSKDELADDDVEEENGSQDRDPHFVRACAVEMHLGISQEPRCARIYKKNAADQDRGPHFVRACTVKMHLTFHNNHFMRKFTGKMPQTSWNALIKHWPLHSL